jgi:hypothetical protein
MASAVNTSLQNWLPICCWPAWGCRRPVSLLYYLQSALLHNLSQLLKAAMGVQPFVLACKNAISVLFMHMQLLYAHMKKACMSMFCCFCCCCCNISPATDHVLPSFVSKVTGEMNAGVLQCTLRLFHHHRHLHLPRARRQSPYRQLPLLT